MIPLQAARAGRELVFAKPAIGFVKPQEDDLALRERAWPVEIIEASAALGLAVLLAMIGPFGTFGALGLGERLVYWTLATVIVWAPASIMARQFASSNWSVLRPIWARTLAAAAIAAAPGAFVVAFLEGAMRGTEITGPGIVRLYVYVFVLSGATALIVSRLSRSRTRTLTGEPAPSEPAPAAPVATPSVLGSRLGGEILSLTMEDHYLRIVSTVGEDLVLMRMADAARLLSGAGWRIHRSHWVASGAIAHVERQGRRRFAVLADGRHLPISHDRSVEMAKVRS